MTPQKYDEVWNKVLAGHDLGLLSEQVARASLILVVD